MVTENDLNFIAKRGITKSQLEQQFNKFKTGFSDLDIVKPAGIKDGIKKLSDKQLADSIKIYEKASRRLKRLKFVPASGAATRMFKKCYAVANNYKGTEPEYLEIMSDKGFDSIYYLCQNLQNFAFYNDLIKVIEENGSSINTLSKSKDFSYLLNSVLNEKGLNYGNLPKGLLKFHRTNDSERTPVYEHLIEGIHYAASGKNINLHFTVSPEHLSLFKKHVDEIAPAIAKQYKVKFNVTFSIQKPSTDTIAVNEKYEIVRNNDNEILFRPGGHGALIHNLNDVEADIVFIKNIDNVVQDRLKADTYVYKKALAGTLLSAREKAAYYFKKLNKKASEELVIEVGEFLRKRMFVIAPEGYCSWNIDKKVDFLKGKLNRPIRVCGMVRNEGEPGGGPFWVKNTDGSLSLQIVEAVQFAENQKSILNKSSYFNPVDIVCSLKDFKGKNYNLLDFIDHETGFISSKNVNGVDIKALELPGLWNGAMANWNTIFIEVPSTTFTPVKTINDLLRTEHLFENDLLQSNPNNPQMVM